MLWLRSDLQYGFAVVVFLLLVVWATDTLAFVFGRSIGGPKLWPSVSPNKTWAGFIGGVSSSAFVGAVFAFTVPGASSWKLAVIALVLGMIAQAGDLAESALKRHFNVKDAGALIPGHGGLMDRLDGFVAVAVVAALYALLVNPKAPATAVFLG
jgi:phosphatidate cytidylyltransferase